MLNWVIKSITIAAPIPSSTPLPFPPHHQQQQHPRYHHLHCHPHRQHRRRYHHWQRPSLPPWSSPLPITPSAATAPLHRHYHRRRRRRRRIAAIAATLATVTWSPSSPGHLRCQQCPVAAITAEPALCLWTDTSWEPPSPTLNPPRPGPCVGRNRLAGGLITHHDRQSRWAEPRQPYHQHHLILHTTDHTPPSKVNLKVIPSGAFPGQERIMVTVVTPPFLLTWKLSCLLHLLPSAS